MSAVKGSIGKLEIEWLTPPHGVYGSGLVRTAGGEAISCSWRKDDQGIWIELPHGVFGFDIVAARDDDGRLQYGLTERESGRAWESLSFLRAGEQVVGAEVSGKKKAIRVRAQMPGKIVRIMIAEGDVVEKGQALMVMEAMKMENQIKAPQTGRITAVKVTVGQAVETGADLIHVGAAE